MNYCGLIDTDVANGEGVRVSLFVSGCTHHCKNCFNKKAWDFDYGQEFDEETQNRILKLVEPSYISGLTLLGGEPMEPSNQRALAPFIKKFREKFGSSKNIWCYTGYIFDRDLVKGGRAFTEQTKFLIENFDVMVDGPFVDAMRDITLKFRGSKNQRVIDVQETLKMGEVINYFDQENGQIMTAVV